MSQTLTSIYTMQDAIDKARTSVANHLRELIRQALDELTESGFAYEDALDILTQQNLFLQFLLLGKAEAETKIDLLLVSLSKDEDFAD